MRGKPASKRQIKPDYKYNSTAIAKLINYIMRRGKKSIAEKNVYIAFNIVEQKTKEKALDVFEKALKNTCPLLEVRARRIGGANYQVPVEVRPDRRFTLGCRWMIEAAKKKKGKPMMEKLAEEIMLAAKGEGEAVKKRQDVHRMAEANRAFAHFA